MIAPTRIPALTHEEQSVLDRLLGQLSAKAGRNLLRAGYYDAKNAVTTLGIATPPNMARVNTVLGWPSKAVDILNRRCNLDGFVMPDGDVADLGIPELMDENSLDIEAPQAGVSSLIHACAFLVTTQGDVEAGEPEVVITARDALTGTGIWDNRRRALSAFLSVIETSDAGEPLDMVLYLPGLNVFMTSVNNVWRVERREHILDRVPVEPLVYQPRLTRRFGSSRISRPVMALTDAALRTMIRSEVSAEFYSAPQRYLLGADEKAFQDAAGNVKSQWQAIMGRVWAIDADEDGNVPTVGQFPASSQAPHIEQFRQLAQSFSGETSIPITSLGVSSDANPTSSDSYHASREDLIHEAEGTTRGWSPAWSRTIVTALQLREGREDVPPEWTRIRPNWRNPATPSRASAADAMLKLVTAFPWIAESEVALEMVGFDATQIDRLLADKRRAGGSAALRAIAESLTPPPPDDDLLL